MIHVTNCNSCPQNPQPVNVTYYSVLPISSDRRLVQKNWEHPRNAEPFSHSMQWICRALYPNFKPNSVNDLHKIISKGYGIRFAISAYDRTQRRNSSASQSCNLSSSHSANTWRMPHDIVFVIREFLLHSLPEVFVGVATTWNTIFTLLCSGQLQSPGFVNALISNVIACFATKSIVKCHSTFITINFLQPVLHLACRKHLADNRLSEICWA